jgi:putative hemolysin
LDPDFLHHSALLFILKQDIGFNFFLSILLILILLSIVGMMSGSEVAFFSIKEKLLDTIRHSKSHSDKKILKLLQNPKELLATILITNTLVMISLVILFTITTNKYFDLNGRKFLTFFIQVILLTIILVIFGELSPKIYANESKLKVARSMAYPLSFLTSFFYPLSAFMVNSTNIIEKRIKRRKHVISIEDLKYAIDITSSKSPDREGKNILTRIVNFGNVYARQIMTSRMNVITFEDTTPFSEILSEVNKNRFSRVPVFSKGQDNIIGILYIKDLIPHFDKADDFSWQNLLRKPFFVPENKKIDDLLRDFQAKKVHMAVVVDEYGGFSGVVTLEDILEEIVGEITDEFDEASDSFRKIAENVYIFDAATSLSDLIKLLQLTDTFFESRKGESETLGGLITEILGKIPEKGENIEFENIEFTIEDVDKKRIKRVKITITPEKTEKSEE